MQQSVEEVMEEIEYKEHKPRLWHKIVDWLIKFLGFVIVSLISWLIGFVLGIILV